MSEDKLMKILSEPESKTNSPKLRIKEIREEFNELQDRFSKLKIKEIRRNIYENEKKSFSTKSKRDWKRPFRIRK